MTEQDKGASPDGDRAGGPTDLSRSASQPEALIPSAAAVEWANEFMARAGVEESYRRWRDNQGYFVWARPAYLDGFEIGARSALYALHAVSDWVAQGMPSEGPRREGGSGASAPASPVHEVDAPND